MPALRGLIASLGAGVSLAAAGALALLAISALVAFQGWPGLGADADGRTLQLSVPRSEPAELEDDGAVMLADAPDEAPSAGDDTGEPGGGAVPDPTAAGEGDALVAPSPPSPTGPLPGFGPAPPAPTAPTPAPSPPSSGNGGPVPALDGDEPVSGLTGLTGDVLRSTGRTVSPVTDALLPGSGKTVEGLTDVLGDTVESTGGVLGASLGLLLLAVSA